MARKKKSVGNAPTNKKTASEVRDWYNSHNNYMTFADNNEALKNLRDIQKSTIYRNISNFNKESLRTYLQNPSSNEQNLRNLSRYLSYRSQVYYRLLMYNANMFDLKARSVIPPFDPMEDNDEEATIQSWFETLKLLDKMNLQYEFLKVYFTCFREDVFYGVYYFDENSENSSALFFLPLDPDYCKIQGVWEDGSFAFAMDMTYFRRNKDLLEYWGEPFDTLYRQYESSNEKWQTIPQENSVCLKARAEDWETIIPVFSGLLNSIISLIDQEDISAIADQQSIYKLVWMELETMNNTEEPDDWKVDPRTAIPYFNRLVDEAIPDYTSSAIVPGKLNTISFDNDQATDTTKVEKATKTVLNTSGGAQILNSSDLSTSAAFNAVVKADTEFAISMLLPQTEIWLNSFIARYVNNPSYVKFFEVSTYTKKDLRDELLENGQNGLPTQLAVNTLSGFSELETMSLNFLEQTCLKISDKFKPMSTSYTQSEKDAGGQEKDADELTDEGQKTSDGGKNDK